tara:strand:- start:73 stop:507 length:435 start_codon:yes stop_codon:yes gene_type:complete
LSGLLKPAIRETNNEKQSEIMSSITKKLVSVVALAAVLVFAMSGQTEAANRFFGGHHGGGHHGGGHHGGIHIGGGFGGIHIGHHSGGHHTYPSPGCYQYPSYRQPTYHNTSHYDYHAPQLVPHGNHYDYQPGHWDRHNTGHWDH